ncbi:hypothetical protein LCGC14_2607340 [marine sediment metagenome]|uniref:Uncharacterized protein n=1 Tax=marine sediment metagenome TaxID=412755 RepID=A0A0F9AUK0_9ZZZZ
MTTVPACGGCGEEVDTSKSHRVVEGLTYHPNCSDAPTATEGNGDENKSNEPIPTSAEEEEKSNPTEESNESA